MQPSLSLACFLSVIRPPGVQFEDSLLQILPVDKTKCPFVRDKNDVEFRLFTRHNPTVYQELRIDDDEALFASHFNFHDPTVFYFGAFLEAPDEGSGLLIRQSYMLKGDTNFVILDISRLEAGPWYFTAAENTWYIGNFAARFIDYMVTRGLNLNTTHLIGHSLGAQSAGVAGYAIRSGRVSRITGLDPALPLFSGLPLPQRLDPSDGEFVDVIHTDAGIFGYKTPIGHVDFYPNGGISPQPGCELEVVLHEQRLLNKCDPNAHPEGFYLYQLTPNKKLTLAEKLLQFFTYIYSLTEKTPNTDVPLQKTAGETKRIAKYTYSTKTEDKSKKPTVVAKLKKVNDKKGKHETKLTNIMKIVNTNTEVDEKQTFTDDINSLETTDDSYNTEPTYKREKRVSSHENYTDLHNTKTEQEIYNITAENITKVDNSTVTDTEFNETHTELTEIEKELELITEYDSKTTEKNAKTTENPNKTTQNSKLQRQKRFISLFRNNNENESFLFRMLEFLVKNRKNVIPVVTVMREINTLVKSANGELNHSSKERNNYIGGLPTLTPIKYDLELGETGIISFVKKLIGIAPKGGKLSISGNK